MLLFSGLISDPWWKGGSVHFRWFMAMNCCLIVADEVKAMRIVITPCKRILIYI